MPERNSVQKLAWDLKVTAGCRFNAASRLSKREKGSNILVSVYSAILICVSIATFSLPLDSGLIRYVSFGGIVASILLLVMSMRNFAHQFGVEAEQMHRSALEINELRRLLLSLPVDRAEKRLEEFSRNYNEVLQKWSVNHDERDFVRYKYRHKWEFDDIADTPDDKLPDKMFREVYDVSAGGVAILTLLGAAFVIFMAYILWDSVAPAEPLATEQSVSREVENLEALANELEKQADEAERQLRQR